MIRDMHQGRSLEVRMEVKLVQKRGGGQRRANAIGLDPLPPKNFN